MQSVDDLPVLDFSSPEYIAAPFVALAGWARKWKVARSVRGVEILDYELCRTAIVDPNLGTGHPRLMEEIGLPESAAMDFKRNAIGFHNRGARRRDLRLPMNRLFAPARIEGFRDDVKAVVAQVVGALPKDRPVDMIAGLCDPIPSMMYCNWVGAPYSDAEFVGRTSHIVQAVHTRDPSRTAEIVKSFDAIIAYVEARIEHRRANPADDLLNDLIECEKAGELSATDMRNWVIVLAAANTDNTSHSIGTTLIELASRPEVWTRLSQNPQDVPAAVAEVMRYHPRSISTSRETMADMEIAGVQIPKGTPVFANFGASHFNAAYYKDPEVFDIDRTDPPHLNFGGGIFSCIGRYFVTMEIEETIAYLAQNHPHLRIDHAAFEHSPMFTSVTALEVQLDP